VLHHNSLDDAVPAEHMLAMCYYWTSGNVKADGAVFLVFQVQPQSILQQGSILFVEWYYILIIE
jgi:hypothetical protein